MSALGIEQLFLRADTLSLTGDAARAFEAAVTRLTSLCVGHPRPVGGKTPRYELQIREQPGGRPLVLTIPYDPLDSRFVTAREIMHLMAFGVPGSGL